MYKVFVFLCVAMTIGAVYSAVGILGPVEKPEEMAHQDGCYIPDYNRVIPYNEPYSPQDGKNCQQFLCREDNTTYISSCGAIAVFEPCERIPGDITLPYPERCDQVTCNAVS